MLSLFDKLKIKHRLLLLIIIPLCGFAAVSFRVTLDKYVGAQEAARMVELSRLSVVIGPLVHEVQSERAMTSGFLGSKGGEFAAELPAKR